MSGAKTVVALIDKDGAYIDSLNPLPTTGGGGGGGAVTQGAGSDAFIKIPVGHWGASDGKSCGKDTNGNGSFDHG